MRFRMRACVWMWISYEVYVILGHHYEHVGLMLSLKRKRLLEKGEYFVVGIDIEQYDATAPDKYLRGLLQDQTDDESITAFKSYLGIVPSPPSVDFDEFARQVKCQMDTISPHYLPLCFAFCLAYAV